MPALIGIPLVVGFLVIVLAYAKKIAGGNEQPETPAVPAPSPGLTAPKMLVNQFINIISSVPKLFLYLLIGWGAILLYHKVFKGSTLKNKYFWIVGASLLAFWFLGNWKRNTSRQFSQQTSGNPAPPIKLFYNPAVAISA